jgi:hypothetical protein
MTNIDKFKSECKDILINNLGKCLQHLSDALSPESKLRDDVLLLKGDFIRWQRQSSQLSSIEYHQYLNRISNGLMKPMMWRSFNSKTRYWSFVVPK